MREGFIKELNALISDFQKAIMAYAIILIAQYGYRNDLWSETVGKIIHIDKEPTWNLEDLYIKDPNGQSPVPFAFHGDNENIQ